MNNFRLNTPTELIFGKDTLKLVGSEVKKYSKRILLVRLTEQSLKDKGIFDELMDSLTKENIEVFHLEGIKPNPVASKVREGIEICKQNNIDFLLAVGGGSVIDTAKAICAGACHDGDFFELFDGRKNENFLKLATIVTIPATGTEMNDRCVITDDETNIKKGTCFNKPVFSILNPEFCKTLPKNRIAQVCIDSLAHNMERYFTNTQSVELTDAMLEAVMRTVIEQGTKFYNEGYTYETASQVMYGGTVSHNFTLCVGRETDWASHNISYPLSGVYDLPHAEALSIIFPAWIKFVRNNDKIRMARFFTNVVGTSPSDSLDDVIDRGILDLENLYKSLGAPTRMSDVGIKPNLEEFADIISKNGTITHGTYIKLTRADILEILKLAL